MRSWHERTILLNKRKVVFLQLLSKQNWRKKKQKSGTTERWRHWQFSRRKRKQKHDLRTKWNSNSKAVGRETTWMPHTTKSCTHGLVLQHPVLWVESSWRTSPSTVWRHTNETRRMPPRKRVWWVDNWAWKQDSDWRTRIRPWPHAVRWASLKKYLARRPPEMTNADSPFYLESIVKLSSKIWFKKQPLGKKFARFFHEIHERCRRIDR